MQDPFNPYRQWLALPDGRQPANYYALLGLPLFEADAALIAQAADCLKARIRGIRPGEHLAQWQSLLDQITVGKACLVNPELKTIYDAGLRGQAAPWQPAGPAPGAAAPPLPSGQASALATPPEPMAQTPASEIQPPSPIEPLTALMVPPSEALSGGGSCLADAPVEESLAGDAFTPSGSYAPAERRTKPGVRGPLVQMLLVLCVATAGILGLLYYGKHVRQVASGSPQTQTRATATAALPPPPDAVPKSPFSSGQSRAEAPQPGAASPAEKFDPQQQPTPQETPPAAAPPKPADSGKTQDKPRPQQQEQPEPPLDPHKQAALQKSLADTRAAMSDRNLAAARKHLDLAGANAQTPEEQAAVTRWRNLLDYLAEFWRLIRQIASRLQTADELDLGNTRVIVVEASATELVIKDAGRVNRFRVELLPTRLVVALAEMSLAKDPQTKAIFGAFLAVDRNGDLRRALQLWSEAERAGLRVKELLPELGQPAAASTAASDQSGRSPLPNARGQPVRPQRP